MICMWDCHIQFSSNLLCDAVDVPPSPNEVLGCVLGGIGARLQDHRIHFWQVAMLPWLHWANEVDDLGISAKSGNAACGKEQGYTYTHLQLVVLCS